MQQSNFKLMSSGITKPDLELKVNASLAIDSNRF